MIVIDAHLDLAWNALNWNRDITLPVEAIRQAEVHTPGEHRGRNTVALPEMRKGNVAVCFATVLARSSGLGEELLDYRSREIASAMAQGQLAYYRILERQGQLRMLKDWSELETHVREWQNVSPGTPPIGYILSMEGADPILSADELPDWWRKGLRVVGLAHYGASTYAHGTGSAGGLTPQGFELLQAMEEVGMILDLTHLSEEGFWQALDAFQGRVLASHTNCQALVPGDRQFSDAQICALINRRAVIGVAFDAWMLLPGWSLEATAQRTTTLANVADQIDHICQLAGNARHVAIGSDLDGGFGREQSPHDLDTIADLENIPALLQNRGCQESDIELIMHGNWLNFFQTAWGAREEQSAGR